MSHRIHIITLPALLFALMLALTTGCQPQNGEEAPAAPAEQQEAPVAENAESAEAAVPYPLDYCLVTNEKLGSMGEPISQVFQGREFKVCCAGCIDTLAADVPGYLAKLDSAIAQGE
ncbi:MAG: hypothetical protein ACOX52_21075 [Verrucomicrobiota bacterium]|jgi:hypothetical protein